VTKGKVTARNFDNSEKKMRMSHNFGKMPIFTFAFGLPLLKTGKEPRVARKPRIYE